MRILLHRILICCIILSTFTTHIHISLLQKYVKHKYILFKVLNTHAQSLNNISFAPNRFALYKIWHKFKKKLKLENGNLLLYIYFN